MTEVELFFIKLGEKIDNLIDKEFDKEMIERGYYEFVVKVDILDESFRKKEELTILDTREQHYCLFCKKESHYYCNEEGGFLCAECYGKIKGRER